MTSSMGPNEYFDVGAFHSWSLNNWSDNGEIPESRINAYLDSYAQQLKERGVDETTFSFAQVADISKLVKGEYSQLNHSDALWMLEYNVSDKKVGGNENLFQYMVQRLNQDDIHVGLSFGGEAATQKAWNFDFSDNSPTSLASELSSWAHSMGISSLDFDVESSSIDQNDPQDLANFFTALHKGMGGDPVTLTVMGDASQWGPQGSVLGKMFQCAKFQDMFSGMNLMLYNGQYYLNAGTQQSWGLMNWIDQLEKNTGLPADQCASFLNIGFNSAISYQNPSSSGSQPPPFTIPTGLNSGQAAAYIYNQLEKELQKETGDSNLQLGKPFFWDNNANYDVSSSNNYESQFFDNSGNFQKDFFDYQKTLLRQDMRKLN